MAILTIKHVTRYRYAKPVWFGEHQMMFRPRESFDQHVLSSDLKITPEPAYLRYRHDVFGNCIGIARFSGKAKELVFESTNTLEHSPELALDQPTSPDGGMNSYPFAYTAQDLPDVYSSMLRANSDTSGQLDSWSRQFLQNLPKIDAMNILTAMTRGIHKDFKYIHRAYGPPQAPVHTLRTGTGTCRDFAVLMMEAARGLGLAVRFVSGYLHIPATGGTLPRLGGGNTHAWVRVFFPNGGWVEFDPTNGLVGNKDLIRVAVVRDPRQAIPLCGAWEGDAGDYLGMDVEVDVQDTGKPFAVVR
ncbi:MAG: transglutaminase family protein [Alphaproteobacteria bacterium]|nr:transglutaminase family protein [Alphaproteobacteria bacterium]